MILSAGSITQTALAGITAAEAAESTTGFIGGVGGGYSLTRITPLRVLTVVGAVGGGSSSYAAWIPATLTYIGGVCGVKSNTGYFSQNERIFIQATTESTFNMAETTKYFTMTEV